LDDIVLFFHHVVVLVSFDELPRLEMGKTIELLFDEGVLLFGGWKVLVNTTHVPPGFRMGKQPQKEHQPSLLA
jgi:hypothetical protein